MQPDDLDRSFDSEMTELYYDREAEDDLPALDSTEDGSGKDQIIKDDINLNKAVVSPGDEVDEGFVTPQWSPEKDGEGNGKEGETGDALKNLIDSIGESDLLHMQLEPVSEETLSQALATEGIGQPVQRRDPVKPRGGLGRGKPYHTPPRPKTAGRGSGGRGARGRGTRGGAAVGRGRGTQVPTPASSATQSNLLDIFKGHGGLLAGLGVSSPPVASPEPRAPVPKQKPKVAQVKKAVAKMSTTQAQRKPVERPQQQSPLQEGMSPALASMFAGHSGLLQGIGGSSQGASPPPKLSSNKAPTKAAQAKKPTPAKPARGKKATGKSASPQTTHVQPQASGKKSSSPPAVGTGGSSALAQMFSGSSSLLQGLGIQVPSDKTDTQSPSTPPPPKADPQVENISQKGKPAKKPRAPRKPKASSPVTGGQQQETSVSEDGSQTEARSEKSPKKEGGKGDAKPKGRGRAPKAEARVGPKAKPKVQGRGDKSKVQDICISSSTSEQEKASSLPQKAPKSGSPSCDKTVTEAHSRPSTPATRPVTPAGSVHSTCSVKSRPGTPMTSRVDTPTPTTPEKPQKRSTSRASSKAGSRPASRAASSRPASRAAASRPGSRAAGSRPGSRSASQCGSDSEGAPQKTLAVAIQIFKCGSCEEILPSRASLEEHMNVMHRIAPKIDTPPATESDSSGDEGVEEPISGSPPAQQHDGDVTESEQIGSIELRHGEAAEPEAEEEDEEEQDEEEEQDGSFEDAENEEGNFWCSTCKRSWKKYDDYDKHLREVHDKTD